MNKCRYLVSFLCKKGAFVRFYNNLHNSSAMAASEYTYSSTLLPYEAPQWAVNLKGIPKHKIQLGHLNTPIHKWEVPDQPDDVQIYIKRDDMTGCTLSGNKVRKLEFLLADAVEKNCTHIITCGGIQSNHCRATAVASVQLGLHPHLILRSDIKDKSEVGSSGNLFLDRLCGAELYMIPRASPYESKIRPRMEKLAEKLRSELGEESYLIPVGGSDSVGVFGYLAGFQELLSQGVQEHFDDIVFACGSGGTAAGLCIGNYLTGSKLKIHGISVSDDATYFHGHVNDVLQTLGLDVKSEDILDIIDGFKGRGYGISTQEELDFITAVSTKTSIMLDPVYTGKAVRGMILELTENLSRFKGKRILYIHTGGVFGMYDGKLDQSVLTPGGSTDRVKMWLNQEEDPL